ncbi:MAG: OadG family protein [Deltaproteobacteria bacterium]|nr:OadG family protein [Deltaproteobacteria bacterium]
MSPLAIILGVAGAPSTALPAHPTLLQNLEFQLVGLVIVMGALLLMYLLCAGIGQLFQRAEGVRKVSVRASEHGATAQLEPVPAAVDEVPIVAITAAVAAVVEAPHRVVEVKPVAVGWSIEGRRQLLTSHQLRK